MTSTLLSRQPAPHGAPSPTHAGARRLNARRQSAYLRGAPRLFESVTRQPEVRAEITSIQWLGFALTEAIFCYGLVARLIAYVL